MKNNNLASGPDRPNANKYHHITISGGEGRPPIPPARSPPAFSNPKGPRLAFRFTISGPTFPSPIPPPPVESTNLGSGWTPSGSPQSNVSPDRRLLPSLGLHSIRREKIGAPT